jgi:hypothetical protein
MLIVQAMAMTVLQLLAAGAGCQMDDVQMSKSSASKAELFARQRNARVRSALMSHDF